MRIPMSRPSLRKTEIDFVAEVFKTNWLGEGSFTEKFENEIGNLTGAQNVVAVNTGTSALHLSLAAIGTGFGDEVILPSLTFAADPMAVVMCGAKPVFCEVDPETLNLDPRQLEKLITDNTRVVMPTDFGGLPCNVPAIKDYVGKREIKIIRDASHSFGSLVNGKIVGVSDGEDITCFSFDPIKNLTCGEGGCILVDDTRIADIMRIKKRLGIEKSAWIGFSGNKNYEQLVTQSGFRYHMSNINAAIGLAQLQHFDQIAAAKQQVAKWYDELLGNKGYIELFKKNYNQIVPFMYIVRVEAKYRDNLIQHLIEKEIHAGLRYFPCHLQPFFSSGKTPLPITEKIANEILSLPLYADMTRHEVEEVVETINVFFETRSI